MVCSTGVRVGNIVEYSTDVLIGLDLLQRAHAVHHLQQRKHAPDVHPGRGRHRDHGGCQEALRVLEQYLMKVKKEEEEEEEVEEL